MSRLTALLVAIVLFGSALARAEQELAVYPGAVHTRIGNELVIGGQLHRMAYFVTDDSIRKVATHFHGEWHRQGLPTTINAVSADELVVSSFRTREGLQRSVILRRHGNKTVGFTVLKDLWIEVKPPLAPLQPLENTLMSSDMVARDDGGNTQHRTQVVAGGLEPVAEQLASRLRKAGFGEVRMERETQKGRERITLQAGRSGEQLVSVITPLDAQRVAVLQTWVGSDRPDAVANDVALDELRRQQAAGKREGR